MNKNKFLKMIVSSVPYYLWIILIYSTITLIYDIYVAAAEFAILLVLFVLYKYVNHRKRSKLTKYIKSDTYGNKISESRPMEYLPLPIVIVNQYGNIVWNNKAFYDMLDIEAIYDISITDYIPEFDVQKLLLENSSLETKVIFNSKSYNVFGNIIYSSDKNDDVNLIFYWNDITKFEELKHTYDSEKFVSCVAVIDNYDELMQNTLNSDKPKLVANIEEMLQNYAQDSDGILRKYEKDRFFFYFQKQFLDKFSTEKFQIIDRIKEISVGNKISPTLSMGIGVGGKTMLENESFSFAALDMALGRGGDQVIVKEYDEYQFFGGKSTGIEKHSRVKSRIVAHALKGLADNADKIFIMGHKRADIDVLGSAIGLYTAFKHTEKNIYIVIDRGNQTVEKFLSSVEHEFRGVFIDKNTALEYVDNSSLVIVVDTHKSSLVEQPELLNVTSKIVIIDHHRRSADFIPNAILTYHEPYASSASELVTEVIQYIDEGVVLDKNTAEALYAGIYLDTKGFNFKTGVRTFEAAAYLRRNDVDTIKIKKLFQVDINTFMNRCNIIERVRELRKSIAIATCTKIDNADMQMIVAQSTDELLNINNITTAFVLCDMGEGNVIISARSLGETNVQVIMEKLGGGGHMTIAGAQLKDTTLEDAEQMLTQAVDECI